MKDVMGLIYTSKHETSLRELTASRAVAALPVGGRYRMIDFMLSSMVNSGIRNVGVIMQKNYHSLMDHLGSGKAWDLHTRNDGLFILPPFLTRDNVGSYSGILDALRSNLGYLRRSNQEYIIITGGHTALSTTFDDLMAFHMDSGADISLMYARKAPGEVDESVTLTPRHVYLSVDGDGLVTDLEIGPTQPKEPNFYMDIMLLRRDLLLRLIDEAFSQGTVDINREILQRNVHNGPLRICALEYKGYNRRVETINSYYALNMDMLNRDCRCELFGKYPVYTKVHDEVPVRYVPGGSAHNSLVADGCVIEGTVENSILFRGVHIGKDVHVRDSIIMQGDVIQSGVEIEHVILDKHVTVLSGNRLIAPRLYPIVVGKNKTV